MKHQTTTDRVILAVIIAMVFAIYACICICDWIVAAMDWIAGVDIDRNKHL